MTPTKLTLSTPILQFIDEDGNENTMNLNRCMESFHITGAVGSGKSSGSAQYIAIQFLRKGFGGIVLTAKTEEKNTWINYCKATGRLDDLVIFEERASGYCFDPLMYLSSLKGGRRTQNIVNLLYDVSKIGDRITGSGNRQSSDPFWEQAPKRLLTNCVNLLILSEKDVSFGNFYKLVQAAIASVSSKQDSERSEFLKQCLKDAIIKTSVKQKRTLGAVKDYFYSGFANIPENTRGSILETLLSILNPFLSGMLADYFTGRINEEILPERTFEGKIILINFPVKEYFELGAISQMIYKRLFQRTVERRNLNENDSPVFQFIDEAHYFLDDHDSMFLTTARSKRCCSVYITQNISNYYAAFGGYNAIHRVNSILGNLVHKIIHCSNDAVSLQYYADLISKSYQRIPETNPTTRETKYSWRYAYQVEPNEFTKLKKGSEENDFITEAYIVSTGRWNNGQNFMKIEFNQLLAKEQLDSS